MRKYLVGFLIGLSFIASTAYAATVLMPTAGGSGTGNKPTQGQILVGNASSTYTPTTTWSSSGINLNYDSLNFLSNSVTPTLGMTMNGYYTQIGIDHTPVIVGDFPTITDPLNRAPFIVFASTSIGNASFFMNIGKGSTTTANIILGNDITQLGSADVPSHITLLGRTGSNWNNASTLPLKGPDMSYLYSTEGDLLIGTAGTTTANGNLRFFSGDRSTTSSQRMIMTSDGRLGINTANPTYQISVDGTASGPAVLYLRAGGTGNFVLGDRSSGSISAPTATGANSLLIITGGGYDGTKWVSQKGEMRIISDGVWTTTSTPTYFTFATTPIGSLTTPERMRITSGGNVGINTTTPATTFDVNGTSSFKNICFNGVCRSTWPAATGGDAYLANNQTFTGINNFATTTLAYNSTIGNTSTYFTVVKKTYGAFGSLPMVKFNSTGFAFGPTYGAFGDALIIGEETTQPQFFLVNSDISKTAGFSLTTSTGDLNINADGKIILSSNTSIPSTLTLNTSFNGLLKASTGVVSVATPGSDYVATEVDPIWIADKANYFKLTGIPGGQIAYGGTNASDNLTLGSTSHATKGLIKFGTSVYDEATDFLALGKNAPTNRLDIGYGNLAFIQVPAPGALTATLVTTTGNVNVGTHSYETTYITAVGETYLSTISNVVTVVTTTEAQISLTGIPTSTISSVTQRKIYRTKAGGTDYYLLTTLTNNTATTFTDNVADASLGADSAKGRDNTTAGWIYTNGQKGGYIGSNNDALGYLALDHFTYGSNNVAMGASALTALTTGVQNFGLGNSALGALIDGASNVAVGHNAIANSIHDSGNVGVGRQALISVNGGTSNTCVGYNCLLTVSTGAYNIGIGFDAGYDPLAVSANAIKTGNANIAIGYRAGQSNTGVWSNSVAIGKDAMFGASNVFALGGVGTDAVKVGMGTPVPSSTLHLISNITDGVTAITSIFDTATTWSTTGAKLTSWRNNTVEKAFIDYSGAGYLANYLMIATTTPNSTLTLNGSFSTPYRISAIDTTLTASDYSLEMTAVNTTSTLPTAIGITGRIYEIDNSSAGNVNLKTTSSQTINGLTTQIIPSDSNIKVQSNGTNWRIK